MAIPDYETLMLPLLPLIEPGPLPIRDISSRLADQYDLNMILRRRNALNSYRVAKA
jgi:hypothetical protein